MLCEPTVNADVVQVACPELFRVAVQRVVDPSLKVTVVPATAQVDDDTLAVNVTACPTVEGLMDDVTVVVQDGAWTVCATPVEALLHQLTPSPEYVAISVFAPALVGVNVQEPVPLTLTFPVQLALPSLTNTVPALGVPPPDVTEKLTVMDCPSVTGFGVWDVIVTVVMIHALGGLKVMNLGNCNPPSPAETKAGLIKAPVVPLYRRIWLLPWLATYRFPSGPKTMPCGSDNPPLPVVTKTPKNVPEELKRRI